MGLSGAEHPELSSPAIQQRVLAIARQVAHGSVRRNAPLATFLAGHHLATRQSQGARLDAVLDEVASAVARLIDSETPAAVPPRLHCASCGCQVEAGAVVQPCSDPDCCCQQLPRSATSAVG